MNREKYLSVLCASLLVGGGISTVQASAFLELDDDAAVFVGNWTNSTFIPGFLGTDYEFARGGGTVDTATFSAADIDVTGTWCIDAHWTAAPARWNQARFQVFDGANLRESYFVDMTKGGGSWQRLGCVTLTKGETSSVVLSDFQVPSDRSVIADGVRWVREEIDGAHMVNEPGIEFDTTPASFPVPGLARCGNGYTDIRSVTVSPPRASGVGYIVVRASGQVGQLLADKSVGLGISTVSGGNVIDTRQWRLEASPSEGDAGNWENHETFAIQHVYTVLPATGTDFPANRTFYLKGCRENDTTDGTVYPDVFTAEYFPTRY